MSGSAASEVNTPTVLHRTSDAASGQVTALANLGSAGGCPASEIQIPPVVEGIYATAGRVSDSVSFGIVVPSNAQAIAGQSSSPTVNAAAQSSEMSQPAPGFEIKVKTGKSIQSA